MPGDGNRSVTGAPIRYEWTEDAYLLFERAVRALAARSESRQVCEVGAGANPLLSPDECREMAIAYTIMDASPEELAKAGSEYASVQANVLQAGSLGEDAYDLIISRYLVEHLSDSARFHRAAYRALRVGGHAAHWFPTLWAWPFTMNRVLPEGLSYRALKLAQRGRSDDGKHGKFPAMYDHCRGPSQRQIDWFQALGFDVVDYVGCFGHRAYYARVPRLQGVHDRFSHFLARHPVPPMTSFSFVVLRRADRDEDRRPRRAR